MENIEKEQVGVEMQNTVEGEKEQFSIKEATEENEIVADVEIEKDDISIEEDKENLFSLSKLNAVRYSKHLREVNLPDVVLGQNEHITFVSKEELSLLCQTSTSYRFVCLCEAKCGAGKDKYFVFGALDSVNAPIKDMLYLVRLDSDNKSLLYPYASQFKAVIGKIVDSSLNLIPKYCNNDGFDKAECLLLFLKKCEGKEIDTISARILEQTYQNAYILPQIYVSEKLLTSSLVAHDARKKIEKQMDSDVREKPLYEYVNYWRRRYFVICHNKLGAKSSGSNSKNCSGEKSL